MRALIIEDDLTTAEHVRDLLAADGFAVDMKHDGQAGLTAAAAGGYKIIIVDRMLPGIEGTDIVQRLRAMGANAPILILSALGRAHQRTEGLESGADDYLAKPFDASEFRARVRALMRRALPVANPEVRIMGELELWNKAEQAHRAGRNLELSPKEFVLLSYLADHAGQIVTRTMLLENVWKLKFDPGTNVIDVHMARLRGKVDGGFERPMLRTVRGEGYVLDVDA